MKEPFDAIVVTITHERQEIFDPDLELGVYLQEMEPHTQRIIWHMYAMARRFRRDLARQHAKFRLDMEIRKPYQPACHRNDRKTRDGWHCRRCQEWAFWVTRYEMQLESAYRQQQEQSKDLARKSSDHETLL